MYGIWSNPKYRIIGNQQPNLEERKVQRLSPLRRVGYKRLIPEVVCPNDLGEDIVCACRKLQDCVCSKPGVASGLFV